MTTPASMKRVLVVGGTSFVASHLLPRLAARGFEVSATRRPGHKAAPIAGVRWFDSDLASPQASSAWPAAIGTVIYLAQSRRWRNFADGATDVFDVNIAGVFRAAEYARATGARRFIVASTGSVYEASLGAAKETDPIAITSPRHFYVAAKIAAELLLGSYRDAMHVITLRLFVPYGAGQDEGMLIPSLINKVRNGEPIELDGASGLRLNPIAIDDVLTVVERAMTLDASATLNVAGPEALTLRDIGTQIGSLIGREPVFQQRAAEERALLGDTSLLAATLGWSPQTKFIDGLRSWI